MSTLLQSELSFFYLDDSTLGGSVVDLSHDLEIVVRKGTAMGLQLNREVGDHLRLPSYHNLHSVLPSGSKGSEPQRGHLVRIVNWRYIIHH